MERVGFTAYINDLMTPAFAKIQARGDGAFNKLNQSQQRFNRNIQTSGKSIINLSNIISTYIGFNAVKSFFKLGAEMEQSRIVFQTLLQDVDKGNALFEQIEEFANVTPLSSSDLQKNAQTLLSFGIAGNKVVDTLKMLGDVSLGNKEKLGSLTLAYSQMQSAGRLMGQDLLQMINAGFNPLQVMSQKTGKSMAQLKNEMSRGAISAQMVTDAFKSATSEGGMFFGMMEKQSGTLAGKWNTLTSKWGSFIGRLSSSTSNFFTKVLDKLTVWVDKLSENIGVISDKLSRFFQFLERNKTLLLNIAYGIGAVIAAYKIMAVVQAIVAATNPFTLIALGVTALVSGLVIAYNKVGWFRDLMNSTWGLIRSDLGVLKQTFLDTFNNISGAFGNTGNTFKSVGDVLKTVLSTIIRLAALNMRIWINLINIFTRVFNKIFTLLSRLYNEYIKPIFMKDWFKTFAEGFREAIEGIIKQFERLKRFVWPFLESLGLVGGDNKSLQVPGASKKQGEKSKGLSDLVNDTSSMFGASSTTQNKNTGISTTAGISGVSGDVRAQRNITISVQNLVNTINFYTQSVKESATDMQEQVKQALLMALNDANLATN